MGYLKESKDCPKRNRCKYGDNCINIDTFRGEYLCFDSGGVNIYEEQMNRHRVGNEPSKKKKKSRKVWR